VNRSGPDADGKIPQQPGVGISPVTFCAGKSINCTEIAGVAFCTNSHRPSCDNGDRDLPPAPPIATFSIIGISDLDSSVVVS
jgi:hypothetical protein